MRFLRKLLTDRRGSIPIEGLFGGLLLLGWYAIAFQFYDAFRVRSIATRATYVVGDLISREANAIGPTYVTGLKKVFDYISNAPNSNYTWLRVTLISCTATTSNLNNCDGSTKLFTLNTAENDAAVPASFTTNAAIPKHTQASINAERDRIPVMAAGDMAVVVESSYTYWPIFGIGDREMMLDGKTWTQQGLSSKLRFSSFAVTRPRGVRTTWNTTK